MIEEGQEGYLDPSSIHLFCDGSDDDKIGDEISVALQNYELNITIYLLTCILGFSTHSCSSGSTIE